MANIETTVNELVINQLSKTKYESLKAAGSLQENQLYMVDEGTETSTSVSSIGGATGDITLGDNLHIENNILSATDTTTTLNGVGGAITLGDGLSMEGSTLKATATGDYYTKEESYSKQEIDNKLSSAYRYIGSVATYDNLPTENLSQGNVYNVEDTGMNYAWTGTKWDALGATFNLDGKQDKLVSGTNIKTINGQDILGSGNLEISGGAGSGALIDDTQLSDTTTYSSNKINSTYLPLSGGKLTGPLNLNIGEYINTIKSNNIKITSVSGKSKLSITWNKGENLYATESINMYLYDKKDESRGNIASFNMGVSSANPLSIGKYASISFGETLKPISGASYDINLGSTTEKWKNLYLSGNISDGTNTVAVSEIAKKTEIPNIVASSTEPANPQEGMVWIQVSE